MVDISIIIPVYNGEKWIHYCMKSIAKQSVFNTDLKIEIVIFNDGSTDKTDKLLIVWAEYFRLRHIKFIKIGCPFSKGVGAAKNGAIGASSGAFLCFQDIDDKMCHDRILRQWEFTKWNHNALVGSRISRLPPNATPRLVRWANNLDTEQLKLQIYTSNGPTILMPTWFCHKSVFERVGGFDESGSGTPEDLIFFYSHLDYGGEVYRINEVLVKYTYHEDATTFSVLREQIWQLQLDRLERCVLQHWDNFTVWNAGKAGRRLVRSLNSKNLNKVVAFCDVDKKKIGRTVELYCPNKRTVLKRIPVIYFADAKPPLIVCMKLDLTHGQFENNLKSMNLTEGKDYILFN